MIKGRVIWKVIFFGGGGGAGVGLVVGKKQKKTERENVPKKINTK